MRTVAECTDEYIKKTPFLYDQLVAGMVNVSALARMMKPSIEAELCKPVSTGCLVMALKRHLKKNRLDSRSSPQIWSDLTVRSGLVEFAFANSPTLFSAQEKLLAIKNVMPGAFLNILQGVFETTILASQSLAAEIRTITAGQHLLAAIDDLSVISLRFGPESIHTHSVYARVLDALSWEGVNIVDVISIYTELALVFRSEDVQRAFRVIESLPCATFPTSTRI
jgi:hypothetical protein